ncbi:MAG: outer membrane protein [Alphaproteobacteria bacterium]|nr:outer membrane protein [Alphaproteobacteria bacterium]
MKTVPSIRRLLSIAAMLASFVAYPVYADEPLPDWSGPYIGVHIGGIWSDFSGDSPSGPRGWDENILGGGQIGANWQFDRLVLGVEGDISKFNTESDTAFSAEEDWLATFRARAGIAMGRLMPYVTGGLALTDVITTVPGAGRDSRVQPGFTAGAGLEGIITQTWVGRTFSNMWSNQAVTGKVEYLYVDVPEENTTIGGTAVSSAASNHIVRFGLNFKF